VVRNPSHHTKLEGNKTCNAKNVITSGTTKENSKEQPVPTVEQKPR